MSIVIPPISQIWVRSNYPISLSGRIFGVPELWLSFILSWCRPRELLPAQVYFTIRQKPFSCLVSFIVWTYVYSEITRYNYSFNELPHYEIRRPPDARQQRHVWQQALVLQWSEHERVSSCCYICGHHLPQVNITYTDRVSRAYLRHLHCNTMNYHSSTSSLQQIKWIPHHR